MNIQEYTQVLSDLQISEIKKKIHNSLIEADDFDDFDDFDDVGDNIDKQIAFGYFVDGICLVYLNTCQEGFNELNSPYYANFAINEKGEFISIEYGTLSFTGLELSKYNKQRNITLTNFSLTRVLQLHEHNNISTDDYNSWFGDKKIDFTDKLLFHAKYKKGRICCYDYLDDDDIPEEDVQEEYSISGVLTSKFKGNLIFSYKGDIPYCTNILIQSRFLLLRAQEPFKEWEEFAGFDHCFASILIDDVYKPRYGLFDIVENKIIIHCGEKEYNGGYINGFVKLEFSASTIYTFDKFDLERKRGIPYRAQMQQPSHDISVNCVTGIRKYLPVNVIHDPFGYKPGFRSGLYAGPLFIIREGDNAGRNISWLKMSDPKTLARYIKSGYLHIDNFKDFVSSGINKTERHNLWLAHDLHFIYEEISDPLDILRPSDFSLRFYPSIEIEYLNVSFEDIIDRNPKYIINLINMNSLIVSLKVFSKIREKYCDDDEYLKKVKMVESSMSAMQDLLDDYNEECDNRIRAEEEKYWDDRNNHW